MDVCESIVCVVCVTVEKCVQLIRIDVRSLTKRYVRINGKVVLSNIKNIKNLHKLMRYKVSFKDIT